MYTYERTQTSHCSEFDPDTKLTFTSCRLHLAHDRSYQINLHVVFVPGYDPTYGRLLTQGADVWLNTPRRPHEASGTSGQKAALNGNPNLSVLDGWWPEAADGINGWSIEGGSDIEDAVALYDLLETAVLPRFRDPNAWARMMAHVFATCVPVFNTDRMVRDYCRLLYEPEST